MSIAAIPTSYAGCRFRSRLEARWAVFFDAMGIEWRYEPEGFRIGRRNYLPDFLLPGTGTWIEVKGSRSNLHKHLMLDAAHELPGSAPGSAPRLVICGPIPDVPRNHSLAWLSLTPGPDAGADFLADQRTTFLQRAVFVAPRGAVDWGGQVDWDDWLAPGVVPRPAGHAVALERQAYLAARGARFEHGESGGPGHGLRTSLQPW
jgi:hypothetical protein